MREVGEPPGAGAQGIFSPPKAPKKGKKKNSPKSSPIIGLKKN